MDFFGGTRDLVGALESLTKRRAPTAAEALAAYSERMAAVQPSAVSLEAQKRAIEGLDASLRP